MEYRLVGEWLVHASGPTTINNEQTALHGFPNSQLIYVEGAMHETPALLLDPHIDFLLASDLDVERTRRSFAFKSSRT